MSAGRGSMAQRARARAVAAASWVACRLPERLLVRAADLAGAAWYRATPARAARARANLGRVCAALAADGRATPAVKAAATDPEALERLVSAAYRHAARYYVEVARTPVMDAGYVAERLVVDDPAAVESAFSGERPAIFVGLHFGAIELPALFLALRVGGDAVAPMETVGDPALQRWFVQTRGRVGIRIVGLREARRELLAALRRGAPVGLVADRDLTGGGIDVPFFGAPAPLPAGPALLALESGSPVWLVAVRRTGAGRYAGRLVPVAIPADGSRRERVEAFLAAEARAFEDAIAMAPEQWWGCFFPIWPDLASSGETRARQRAGTAADESPVRESRPAA